MSELIGSVVLAVLVAAILYFIIASRLRWGFDTTIAFAFPLLMIVSLAITGFSILFAFISVIAGLMLAWIFNQIIGNR